MAVTHNSEDGLRELRLAVFCSLIPKTGAAFINNACKLRSDDQMVTPAITVWSVASSIAPNFKSSHVKDQTDLLECGAQEALPVALRVPPLFPALLQMLSLGSLANRKRIFETSHLDSQIHPHGVCRCLNIFFIYIRICVYTITLL